MEKRNHNATDLTRILLIVFCGVLLITSFFIQQKKRHINEAKKLPFSNTNLELVDDGTYENTTNTSFMRLSLAVTVKDHKFTEIKIIENKGSRGKKADEIIANIIESNKVINSLVDGDEIGNLVFISCVDGALKKGISREPAEK